MEVIVAKNAGFCFGVKRAVDMVYAQIREAGNGSGKTSALIREADDRLDEADGLAGNGSGIGRQEAASPDGIGGDSAVFSPDGIGGDSAVLSTDIYTYGPIAHNEALVRDLQQRGVRILDGPESLEQIRKGTVIIRAHGVSKATYRLFEQKGLSVVDATCPSVKRIHRIVERESMAGKQIVILGNPGHPEVEGIRGWSVSPAFVVQTDEEAKHCPLDPDIPICLVGQTTFNYNKFEELVEIFKKRYYDVCVVNTICHATRQRQEEAASIAARVDAMIVIGGTHSSNTGKLYEICRGICPHTYLIQTREDLPARMPASVRLVGITAGASTPSNIIEEVQNYVRSNF